MERLLKNFNSLKPAELMKLQEVASWSLNLPEMQTAQNYFRKVGRAPTQAEMETLAQTWSEHCKHKTFNDPVDFKNGSKKEFIKEGLFKSTVYKATKQLNKKWCLSVFKDNAGVIEFGQNKKWGLAFKAETHNHPTAVEPYGGASTGVGGCVRDVLGVGLGAKPVADTDVFCVAPPKYSKKLPKGALHPKRIINGAVGGVRDYGNRIGIPTVSGGVWYDDDYVLNPLCFVGTIGIMPTWAIEKTVVAGDYAVSIGGRTGRDGLHGATFSSANIADASEETSAVQVGNAIEEKKVIDAMMLMRDKKLYRAATDCGAGGFSSAIGELGSETGVKVQLKNALLKDTKIKPWEIWVSESQERMIICVPPKNMKAVEKILKAEDCEFCVMGQFTKTGRLEVYYGEEKIIDMENSFLHGGVPKITRKAEWKAPKLKASKVPAKNYASLLHKCLADLNTCSREAIIKQYDQEVQSGTVIKPLQGVKYDGPGDASVVRPVAATGDYKDYNGFALTQSLQPEIGKTDPYQMALNCCDESMRNLLCSGADISKTAFLDNFCWGSPENKTLMGALVLAARGCYDGAMAYGAPFISGKDSFYNQGIDANGKPLAIPSTIIISATAPVYDVRKAVTMDLKAAGNDIYMVGVTKDELGGSTAGKILGLKNCHVPAVAPKTAMADYKKIYSAIQKGLVQSAHDISQGGLAAALAEMCFSGGLGAKINLDKLPVAGKLSDGQKLFSESASRIILEVAPQNSGALAKILKGSKFAKIGAVESGKKLAITAGKKEILAEDYLKLKKSWQSTEIL